MSDEPDFLDRLLDAVKNLQPGEELPDEFQDHRSSEQGAADAWTDELGELYVDKLRDPIAYVGDEAKLARERELLFILKNLGQA